ncbi:MAG: DNA mismatch repair endonuclease MutL [Clostridium sp.]|jgi:DNA mismatch repair protein MutL|nr:DNA mismatch repair endonuclease MutL [Clostridium sp.]
MAAINILPKEIARLIAAGEVVERPASVVKELLENSIDAGASRVTLEIRGGGIKEIRVTDDGCGIAREDVRSAFLPHATSKISSAEDLDAICTLGFRGEALASIAAVARVELLTRAAGEEHGTRYVNHGGEELALEDAGCPPGTTFIVRDLFFNTPARMKFLKKDVSEANAIASVADRLALSHPELSLSFVREDKQTLFTPGDGELLGAIRAVYGKDFAASLIPVDNETNGVRVSGFTGKPNACRATRSLQLFFLNGRLVKTGTGAAALAEAYRGRAMVGKHPVCVLNIALPEYLTDVNVHPGKLEVRFADEKMVFHGVYSAVRFALQGYDEGTALRARPLSAWEYIRIPQEQIPPAEAPAPTEEAEAPQDEYLELDKPDTMVFPFAESSEPEPPTPSPAQDTPAPLVPQRQPRVLGELFTTYIIIELGDELLLLDKHAAHERMIYNSLKESNGVQYAQQLLSPLRLSLGREEHSALLENEELLRKGGFEFSDFGGGTLLLNAVPMELSDDEPGAALEEMAAELLHMRREPLPAKIDWLYHSVACRAAVKAGDYTSDYEREQLALRVLADPQLRSCPHGRPVLLSFSRAELERRFGRLG